jgi:tripartite-type tricarboxylate transporter receptor subunit TctC
MIAKRISPSSVLATGLAALVCAYLGPISVSPILAEDYPTRPITLVIGFAPGSGIDTVCRVVAKHVGTALKQTIVIENKVGANGAIAATYVARALPDGYTLLAGSSSNLSANPSLLKNLSYDPIKDFAPISMSGSFTYMLVVHPQVPARSVAELISYAKANPGKLSFATSNASGLVSGITFKRWADIDINHVPYKTAPPAINDVLGGRVSMMFADVTTALPHVKANTLRGLAVMASKRSALLPDLPSLHEVGLTEFDLPPWNGVFAPANTPTPVIARLNTEWRKVVDDPAIKAQLADIGYETRSSSPEELGNHVKVQLETWSKLVKDAGIEPQ